MTTTSLRVFSNLALVGCVAACSPNTSSDQGNGTGTVATAPQPTTGATPGTAGTRAAPGKAGSGAPAGTTTGIATSTAGRSAAAAGAPALGAAGPGMMRAATAGAGAALGAAGAAGAATTAVGGDVTASAGPHSGSEPVKFEKNIKLNDDSGKARQTEVSMAAGPNGMLIAGWMDERADRTCSYSFSTDGGVTWSKNVSISNTANFVGDPTVGIDGAGNMYAVCQQYINAGSTGQIKLMHSKDKGTTWSEVAQIQSAPDKPWIAGGIEAGTILVSWLGNPGGIKRSVDFGKTWETTQSTGNIIHGTAITTSTTGMVHVPYNADSDRNQLRYLRSKDHGKTWEKARDLLPDMGNFCFQCNPRQHPIVGAGADPTGKYVAITWASTFSGGEGDDDVWLMYSKDSGETWTKPIRVNDNTTKSRQFEPWVAVDNYGRVHVAWTDYRNNGENATYYTRSADPEKGFEKSIEVTEKRGSGRTDFLGDYKSIVVSGDNVVIVWQDTRNDSGDIYVARAVGAAGPP